MSSFLLLVTAIVEAILFPFAYNERRKAQAHEKRAHRYTGQRNRWRDGAK